MGQASPKLQEAWYLRIISPHTRAHVDGAGMPLPPGEGSELGGLIGYLLLSPPKKQPQPRKGFRRGEVRLPGTSFCLSKREGWLGEASLNTCFSLTGLRPLCETWANRRRQASRSRCFPPLFPSQEFPPKVKMCFSLLPACQEPGLHSGMPAPTPLPRPDEARA